MAVDIKTQVKINLTTKVRIDHEEETYELTLFGDHYQKGESIYLKYDEEQEQGTIHTVVKVTDNEATIIRSGLVKMRLTFRLNQQRDGTHETEFGTIFLTTTTKEMNHEFTMDTCEGHLHLVYDLAMQGTYAGKYEMNIVYKELKK